MNISDKVKEIAESLQDECHALTKESMKLNDKLTVQDCTNAYLFVKLAELQNQINDLSKLKRLI